MQKKILTNRNYSFCLICMTSWKRDFFQRVNWKICVPLFSSVRKNQIFWCICSLKTVITVIILVKIMLKLRSISLEKASWKLLRPKVKTTIKKFLLLRSRSSWFSFVISTFLVMVMVFSGHISTLLLLHSQRGPSNFLLPIERFEKYFKNHGKNSSLIEQTKNIIYNIINVNQGRCRGVQRNSYFFFFCVSYISVHILIILHTVTFKM